MQILQESGKCVSTNDVLPLVQVRDVMQYMPQMTYMITHMGNNNEPASKRQRTSWLPPTPQPEPQPEFCLEQLDMPIEWWTSCYQWLCLCVFITCERGRTSASKTYFVLFIETVTLERERCFYCTAILLPWHKIKYMWLQGRLIKWSRGTNDVCLQ